MKNYTFTEIYMEGVEPGLEVTVTHFRINSHYEIGATTNIQRVRKRIVDSVFYRLHGEKRVAV